MATKEMMDLAREYISWIKQQDDDFYTLKEEKEPHLHIMLDTENAVATIDFNIMLYIVVELMITDKEEGNDQFYLHFELNDLDHAKSLFLEMKECLRRLQEKPATKVFVCCSSAMTSSFFVNRLQTLSQTLRSKYEFVAISANRLASDDCEADIVLLAPQISYLYPKVKQRMKDTIVLKIPTATFATYDCHALIEQIELQTQEKQKADRALAERMRQQHAKVTLNNLLVIIVICEYKSKRIMYRLYQNGRVTVENTIIKQKYRVSDLTDIVDVMSATKKIDYVSICTPGIIDNGVMTFRESDIIGVDIGNLFRNRYKVPVFFVNDANAMAAGFYHSQDKYRNLCFYFHPRAARICGVGSVVNGKLVSGRNNLAGEMQFLVNALKFTDDPTELALSEEGILELLTRYMTSLIACIDPEAIIIYAPMNPDLAELRKKLAKTFKEEYIPELIKVESIVEYMFLGGAELMRQVVEAK